jgi:hypothetical protein
MTASVSLLHYALFLFFVLVSAILPELDGARDPENGEKF